MQARQTKNQVGPPRGCFAARSHDPSTGAAPQSRVLGRQRTTIAMPVTVPSPRPCVAGGVTGISFSASEHFEDQSESNFQIKGTGVPQKTVTNIVCPPPVGSVTGMSIGDPSSIDFVLQANVGATSPPKSVPWMKMLPFVHSQVTISIVKVN